MNRAKRVRVDRSITSGSDFLQLRPGEAPAGGLSGWLAGQLRLAIADGRLAVGSKLPASRVLAAELGVSRGVVTEAYRRLTEDGHVAGHGRGGTVVVAAPAAWPVRPGSAAALPADTPGAAAQFGAARRAGGPAAADALHAAPGTGHPADAAAQFGAARRAGGPAAADALHAAPGTGSPAGTAARFGAARGAGGRAAADALHAAPGAGPPAGAAARFDAARGAGGRAAADALHAAPGVGPPAGADRLFAAAPGAAVFDALRAAPARIDLSPGLPDLAAFPRAAWLRAERSVLHDLSPDQFGYGDPRGTPALRRAVATWLARNRGIRAEPGQVCIVAGVAQALALLAQVLRADGIGAVAVEDPGSLGARQQLRNWQLATPPVGVDASGLRVGELRASGAPAVLLTPAHQFPTGVVLDGERRRELMRWAGDGGLIIEDDYDAEHRYDRPPVPALHSMLPGRVCYAASVSKLLAPALRVGWLLAPPPYDDALVAAKRHADLGNAVLPQLVLARLMESGELERQLRFLRGRHRRRRDAMIAAIGAHLPGAVVHGAAAGLHLMITFEAGFADADLAAAALARGVKVHPLSWHGQRPGPPGLVLGYAANAPAIIAEGIAILGRALRQLA